MLTTREYEASSIGSLAMLEHQRLSVTIDPVRGVSVNRDAVISLLRRIAEKEIADSPFLRECGITLLQNDDLQISYAPRPGMRINETAVASLVARMVTREISKSDFLTSCRIRLAVRDKELSTEEH